ncbi:MAG TPA: alpha-xylosidase [Ruminiclostridium sp.]
MKFSNGYWLMKDGFTVINPMDIRDVKVGEDSLTVYVACCIVTSRSDTLNEPLITVTFTSPMPDIIKVKISHFDGIYDRGPQFELNYDPHTKVSIINAKEEASLISGNMRVKIDKRKGWNVDFYYDGKRMTGSNGKTTAYITDQNKKHYIREQLELGIGEYVYGLGERFTPFVKNGQTVDIWNCDGGTSSEQAYKNIPFYITNKGYGVFVNHPEMVSYEIASEVVSRVQFSVEGESLEYYIIGGQSMKDVLVNYTNLTGKPSLPPAWSFGLWLSTSFTTSYDEKTVNSFIDGMAKRDLPLHVFHFDCFWMKEYQWCDFIWDSDIFPDPEGMISRLKIKGLNICVWINPYIAQKSYLFEEGSKKGYLLKRNNGDVWQSDKWQAGMGLVDFTNPLAIEWFKNKLRKLLDIGVNCFKTDFGERIPTDVEYFDGSDPQKMHNYYSYLYNKSVFSLLEEVKGKHQAVLFARSATVGSQKFSVHWGGDCTATYLSMAETLRGGLSLCMSGFGYWSHDIGGFESTASPDVYKRWIAFGLLSSHSRLHGNESYRVPWMFDEESVDVLRFFTKLKCSIMPYIFVAAVDASQKGIPMMRAMVLEFQDDPNCVMLDRQYMFGSSLLVAPIFNNEGTTQYYLPKGTWTNFITGEKIGGGCWCKEKYGYMSLPLMVKPNSIIAVGSQNEKPDYDYADGVIFHAFEIEDGGKASTMVYDLDAKPEIHISIVRNKSLLIIEASNFTKPWSVCLRNVESVVSVNGGSFKTITNGTIITPYEGIAKIEVKL